MKDSEDIAGIGIPFAAGVAAGAILTAYLSHIPLSIPLFLSVLIPIMTALTLIRSDDTHPRMASLAILFLATGVFCSINAAISEGIPSPMERMSALAIRSGERMKDLIASIPYPSQTTGPLVKALLTGDRGDLEKGVIETFRASGASHILALSGLHLGIIYLILSKITSPLGNSPSSRRARAIITLASAGFYTLMTGASPSIVRAFLFITIGETSKLLSRKISPSRILLSALTIQLVLKPGVIDSTGFQLSYLAMAGIVFIYPGLEKLYPRAEGLPGQLDPMRKIWSGAVLSISCQIFTAPLVWSRFHSFPKYFLITNLTALPLTSAVMVLSAATIALSGLGICPDFLVTLNDQSVQALIECLKIISSL